MSAVLSTRTDASGARARIVLLGTGGVGRAVLRRLDAFQRRGFAANLQLVGVANSQRGRVEHALAPADIDTSTLSDSGGVGLVDAAFTAGDGVRIVIDATASDLVAARHAAWLGQGIDVVTANKLGQGAGLLRWQAIRAAVESGRARYGDAASVGAGLPLLRSLRALVAGGDEVCEIAGVLSGSLAWLFHRFDGSRPFSSLVREARDLGYTEPDPRDDLSGADVRRKLLILARAAGIVLDERDIEVQPLLDAMLQHGATEEVDVALSRLDQPLQRRLDEAHAAGRRLQVVARWSASGARVGVEALAGDDVLAGGAGTDNRLLIRSSRYRERPLLIQGPGAGVDVTAAALLDDVLAIAAH